MATLALKPAFPIRTRPSGSKHDHRKRRVRDASPSRPWGTLAVTAGALLLSFFSVAAPMIGDPAGRLFALEGTSTIPPDEATNRDTWWARAFEFTPTMLGPAIPAEMLALAEADADDDLSVITMPPLEVHALPPAEAVEAAPPG